MFNKKQRKRWFEVEFELRELSRRRNSSERETMIVFVYDTECLKDEADDPVNAVLYFHPGWVSDTQKVALCGQLMGTSYFLKDCFFKPRILALQNGKFVLKEFGRFLLAVGTDRNISDYLLQYRADLLASFVRFFHRDLQTISDQFTLQTQYKNLGEKLYHIFETYLPILQCSGHIFQNIPKLRMPKTASNIFLDAIQTLESCQQTKGILGGAILYHNKVVATQLSHVITKQLVLTDPLHIRTPAEQIISNDFHIPNGVQMIVVYLETQQYQKLASDAMRVQNLQTTLLSQNSFPFQYSKRKIKRDKSLIFTNIPEEGVNCCNNAENQPMGQRPKSLLMRPTHLPLRVKNMNSKELPESGIASINFDESDSYPEFIGRTSVCSTPMTENKVLPVVNKMSICANPENENNSSNRQNSENRRSSLKLDFEKFFQHFISNPNKQLERRKSFTDLHDSLKKISKKLSLKQFNMNNQKTDVNRNGDASPSETPDFIENDGGENVECDDNSSSENSSIGNNKSSHTITDPTNPIFNANGQPISRGLFQELVEKYYKFWHANKDEHKNNDDVEIAQLIAEFREFDEELKKIDASMQHQQTTTTTTAAAEAAATATNAEKADRNLNIENCKPKTPLDKRSLSLPIKPLADATSSSDNPSTFMRKQSGGVPLTPLMAKLSVLALSEEKRNNWDAATPGTIEIQTPLGATKSIAKRGGGGGGGSQKYDDAVDALVTVPSGADGLQRAELYVCGQQNMTLLLLMECGSAHEQHIVQKMFDICVSKFPHMESHLSQTLNVNVEGDKRDGSYSFMAIDAKWGAAERKGPWNPIELNTLECMHRDLSDDSLATDLILRSQDAVFYGCKTGPAEFLYKETASQQTTGIPPPSDAMGNVSMRAKSRLERDHSYVLF